MSVCMEISKLCKSQSLLIIFAAVSSLAAKPQNSTSEGNSPRRKKTTTERSTIRKYGSRAQQGLLVSIGQHLSSTPITHSLHFPRAFILLCLGFFPFFPKVEKLRNKFNLIYLPIRIVSQRY